MERWPWQTGVKLCLPEQQSRQKSLQSREILCVILRFFSQEMLLRPLAALLRLLLNDCSMPWHPCSLPLPSPSCNLKSSSGASVQSVPRNACEHSAAPGIPFPSSAPASYCPRPWEPFGQICQDSCQHPGISAKSWQNLGKILAKDF